MRPTGVDATVRTVTYSLRPLTRPLTQTELARILDARARRDEGEQDLRLAIRDAFDHRGNVGQIARTAGVSTQTVYRIVKQLAEEDELEAD